MRTITINNFENNINSLILMRGINYFIENRIKTFFKKDDNEFYATVMGSYLYEVEVVIGADNEIEYSHCTCPYEGIICKHQVAVYYKIKEEYFLEVENKKTIKRDEELETLKEILSTKTKEEIIETIVKVIKDKGKVISEFLVSTNPKHDALAMLEIIDKHLNSGFDDDSKLFGYKLVLKLINEEKDNEFEQIVTICEGLRKLLVLAREFEETLESDDYDYYDDYYDDYDEDQSFFGESMIETLTKILDEKIETVVSTKNKLDETVLYIIDYLEEETEVDYYFEKVLKILKKLFVVEKMRGYFPVFVKKNITEALAHDNLFLLQMEFSMIEEYSGKEAAFIFANRHLRFAFFRSYVIEELLKKEEYESVITLCKEVLSKDKFDSYAYWNKLDWNKYLFLAYKGLNDLDNIRNTALYFLHRGDLTFYEELKKTFTEEMWQSYLVDLLNKTYDNQYIQTFILKEEKLWDKLIDYFEKHRNYLLSYYNEIPKEYYQKYLRILIEETERKITLSTGQKHYESLKKYFDVTKALMDADFFLKYLESLKLKYYSRPAFKKFLQKYL